MAEQTMTGRTIAGRYTITGLLRTGRMGDVYVARQVTDNARVSLKLLDPALFDEPEAISRFERETAVARRLTHPCTMQIVDHGKAEDGTPWMAMEFVEGELLSEVLEEGRLVAARAARIAGQIAMALQQAHDLGVIHRDLQPATILLTKKGGVELAKVREFGLARLQEQADESGLTAVGVRIGAPLYMAPEYIEQYNLDHRADLYSLGIMLFEMLTGAPPFQGRPYKVLDLHLTAPAPAPSSKAEDIPGWLDDLVLALLTKDPDQRPQQARDVVAALERGLGGPIPLPRDAPEPPAPPPERKKPARKPEVDPILLRLMDANTLTMDITTGPLPDLERCLVVERVGRHSLAAKAGVRAGMKLQLPDAKGSGLLDTGLRRPVMDDRRYIFFAPDSDKRIELVTTGLPIGVDLRRTAEHVRKHYDPLDPEPTALLDLWIHKDWEALERLSWRTLTQQRGSSGLLSRLMGSDTIKLRDHPALVTYAAALLEQGKPGGPPLLTEYRSKYATHHGMAFNALSSLYLGLLAGKAGDRNKSLELLWESFVHWPLEATAIRLESLTRQRPEYRGWFGRAFPEYSLEGVDSRGGARLSHTLTQMGSDQLLIVCMLGGFRTNWDYDAFMHRYLSYGAWLHELLFDLHVISTSPRRESEPTAYYRGEDQVLRAGLPFRVLEDHLAWVQRAVKPAAIPTLYVLDKEGMVVHEGRLTEADLWDALALAGKRRLERLREG